MRALAKAACVALTLLVVPTAVDASEQRPRLVVQTGHAGTVLCIASSPKGDLIVTGGSDGRAVLWHAASGRQLRALRPHVDARDIVDCRFAPEGDKILTVSTRQASDGAMLCVIDLKTGEVVHALEAAQVPESVTFADGMPRALLHAEGAPDDKVMVVKRVDTKRVLGRFATPSPVASPDGHEVAFVLRIALSPDGRLAAGGCVDGTVRVWDPASGREVHRLAHHRPAPRKELWKAVTAIAFSPDGERIASGNADGLVVVSEAATGRRLPTLERHEGSIGGLVFSADAKTLVSTFTGKDGIRHYVWRVEEGVTVSEFKSDADLPPPVAFARDGRRLLVGNGPDLLVRDAFSGQSRPAFRGRSTRALDVVFSDDGQRFLMREEPAKREVGARTPVSITDTTTCARIGEWRDGLEDHQDLAFAGDGLRVLYDDGAGIMEWDTRTSARHRIWKQPEQKDYRKRWMISDIGYRPGGFWVTQDSFNGTQRLLTWRMGGSPAQLGPTGIRLAAFTPDGRTVLTVEGRDECALRLRNAKTGGLVRTLDVSATAALAIRMIELHGDGRRALVVRGHGGGDDAVLQVWDVSAGRLICTVREPDMEIRQATFSPHGSSVLLALGPSLYQDLIGVPPALVKAVDATTGRTTKTYADYTIDVHGARFSPRGDVIVWGNDGTIRFLDAASGRERCRYARTGDTWVVVRPDGRFDSDDLETIDGMHWVVPDTPFAPLPIEIFMREYYEPGLLRRTLADEAFPEIADLSTLNRAQPHVDVVAIEPETKQGTVRVTVEVGSRTRTFEGPDGNKSVRSGAHDLRLFRNGHLVKWKDGDLGDEDARFTFEGIRVPAQALARDVMFSAYAFNVDGVKSRTARRTYQVPPAKRSLQGTAYVIAFGVDEFSDPKWNLSFAAADARAYAESLTQTLTATKAWSRVVPIVLISTSGADRARRDDLQDVLRALGGTKPDAAALERMPQIAQLGEARPEDLVIIALCTHGRATAHGGFELLPSDVDKPISTDDLAKWLRPVDAGEMVMVVDACQSAASVEQEGFKPGPMGSRGFGQLAWDKKMRILAASRASGYALESAALRHGLLTHALVREGLEDRAADVGQTRDGDVTIAEWLQYGEARVPALARALADGTLNAVLPRNFVQERKRPRAEQVVQRPALFDFSRKGRRPTVVRSRD